MQVHKGINKSETYSLAAGTGPEVNSVTFKMVTAVSFVEWGNGQSS